MFVDTAKINVKGGDGGKGCAAMRREFRNDHGGPCGGNGGDGGSVYLQSDHNLNTLSNTNRRLHYRAKNGSNGRGDSRHGIHGDDVTVYVPAGTIVRDSTNTVLLGELRNHGDRLLVAKGGKGGNCRQIHSLLNFTNCMFYYFMVRTRK